MTIDREKLAAIAANEDPQLWQYLRATGAQMGLTLPEETPSADTMAKIRHLMREPDKLNMIELMRMYSRFKRGK